jgi:hypothetical protein
MVVVTNDQLTIPRKSTRTDYRGQEQELSPSHRLLLPLKDGLSFHPGPKRGTVKLPAPVSSRLLYLCVH